MLRIENLLPQFKKALRKRDLNNSKYLIGEIQPLLKALNKNAKLIELRNLLFELAMDTGEYLYAIDGFTANRNLINKNTRLHLEATALLAITHIRNENIPAANPLIAEVLKNYKVIKSKSTRQKFNREIIQRFNKESVLMIQRRYTTKFYY